MHTQSIIAQSTPTGKGAIALLRLSGVDVFTCADKFSSLPDHKKLSDQKTHTIHYGWVVDDQGNKIDQVLFLVMHGPHTFTGEDVLEITCHNNPFIVEMILQQAIRHGARLAQPGEFTRRAFENKKMDLVQAEAINELLCAQTEMALKKSLAQLEGSMSHWIAQIEHQLVKAYAWSEASFEFLDDAGDFGEHIKGQLQDIMAMLVHVKKTFDVQQQIRQGFRIALIGSVNAGKSSLFNRLLQQERSIVTDIAGTTRDTVEAGLYRNGNYWTLIDTAGLRQTADVIEQAGIQRSFDEAHKADIIILALDSSRVITPEEQTVYQDLLKLYDKKIILVATKADKASGSSAIVSCCLVKSFDTALMLSSVTGQNCDQLEQAIEAKINSLLQKSDAPFLINKRQYSVLLVLERQLQTVLAMLDGSIQYEIVSYHLREMLEQVSALSGKSVSEAAMDMVFKEFCVGK
jgi:tRNA modification GTPase